jgi:NADPH:quinone reductase-like Zn-dependent oxidoreductase
MNAAVIHAFDSPPRYTTFADPVAQDGELLVTVAAAALHPIVKSRASGKHYSSGGELPFIPGVDGVGRLSDGSRVYFGVARSPYGSFSEMAIAASWLYVPLPDTLDDATAAGIANPAMSSWVALMERAKFVAGETVLILGATGVAGQLAVQIAKRKGAKRIIAAGRNPQALAELKALGADAVISLDQPDDALIAAFRAEWAVAGVDVVLDYLWGHPAECLLQTITQKGLKTSTSRIRYIQIGSIAGDPISLSSAILRSSGLEMLGSGFGSASMDQIKLAIAEFFQLSARDPFQFRIKTLPLSEVEAHWDDAGSGERLVFVP